MRVSVWLPDDLRRRAKEKRLNLSQLLRVAVERELAGVSIQPSPQGDEFRESAVSKLPISSPSRCGYVFVNGRRCFLPDGHEGDHRS